MGLDQYLYKITHIGGNYEHNNIGGNLLLTQNNIPFDFKTNRIVEVKELLMQWRKANAIHKWFVDNVQYGNDDCTQYCVPDEKLQQLKEKCEEALKYKNADDKAPLNNILPTTEGFFFGSTEYDEYYFEELEETIKAIDIALEELKKDAEKSIISYIYYDSSW